MRKVKSVLGDIIFVGNKTKKKRHNELVEASDDDAPSMSKEKGIVEKTEITKKSNKNSYQNEPQMKEIVDSLVARRSSVDNLMHKLNLMDLIEKALFTKSERTPLPLVLLKAEKTTIKE